nr:glycosyltransferase [Candidatus Omnitrophota bacterium]
MSRVLVFGSSPLPFENEKRISGPGIRTWQFVKPLVEDNHNVCLIAMRDRGSYFKDKKSLLFKKKKFSYYSFDEKKFMDMRLIQRLHDVFHPDCIVSISSFLPSLAAIKVKNACPLWFDRGDIMAEAQLKSFNDMDDTIPKDFYFLEKAVLSRGDKFSTVSSPQKYSTIGRLGAMSRLSRRTLGYEFVSVIPCGIDNDPVVKKGAFLRDKHIKRDDFVVLWSGGYNTWVDIDTLFKGISYAMKKNRSIKFVSTGGSIDSQDDLTYNRFLSLINKSEFKSRFIMLGWVAAKKLPVIYAESNLGINVDKNCYETLLGSRHRLMDWMKSGLPFITTTPSEITRLLCDNNLAFTFTAGDSKSLASKILDLSMNAGALKSCSRKIKDFVVNNYSFMQTTMSLREWVKKPEFAPDKFYGKLDQKSRSKICVSSFEEDERAILNKDIDNLKAQLKTLKDDRNNLRRHADNLEGMRSALTQQVDSQAQVISGLQAESKRLTDHLKTLEDDRNNLRRHADNLEGIRSALTQQVDSQAQVISGLQAESKRLTGQLGAAAAEIKGLKSDITNIEQEKQGLKIDIDNLKAHLDKIKGTFSYKVYSKIKSIINRKVLLK